MPVHLFDPLKKTGKIKNQSSEYEKLVAAGQFNQRISVESGRRRRTERVLTLESESAAWARERERTSLNDAAFKNET
jgi:hypothetical protein